MAATIPLREALNQGISSGNFIDTKIILYSYRDSSGRICRPKALYANSHVLKTVPYFNDLLFGNFAEGQSRNFRNAVKEEEIADDYGYLSDSDLEDEDEPNVPREIVVEHLPFPEAEINPSDSLAVSNHDKTVYEDHEECVEQGRVVNIPDVAFVTFQAFLMYLYTGTIEFAPFGSKENRESRSTQFGASYCDQTPRPSPKSIYRLADKYDVPSLRSRALDCIRRGLTKCDIGEESFSRLAIQHDEIRGLYIKQLARTWMEDSTMEAARATLDKNIDTAEEGLEHATEIVFALLHIANEDGAVESPAGDSSTDTVTQATSPAHWALLEAALFRTIRTGVFFDKKYWARHSKSGDVLKPVYFSSIIMNDKAQQLDELVKYLRDRNPFASSTEGDVDAESDCEGDWLEGTNELPGVEGGEEALPRAVLTVGSFSACVYSHLLHSLPFERSVKLLRSLEGFDSRMCYIREKTVPASPPPCSPKSVYVLANLLGMQSLRDMALADIKSKITLDNVVDEVFSQVAAGQEELTDFQWDLLIANFNDPKTTALVKDKLRDTSSGSFSHRASVLKVALRKAFELGKKKRPPPGVRLRCSNFHCRDHNNNIAYSAIGSDVLCGVCCSSGSGYHYFQCLGCRHNRSGNYTSCQSCGKTFV